jgi:MFS family permease
VHQFCYLLSKSLTHNITVRMFGQAIGPVFGGALSQYLGFRSIFYFLVGLSVFVIILLTLYLPETQRKIAGDGTKRLYGIYRPLLGAPKGPDIPQEERYKASKLSFNTLFESFRLLAEKDVAVSLVFGGVIYTVWSMITSSTASLFKEEYHLNEVLIGLAFLPNGMHSLFPELHVSKANHDRSWMCPRLPSHRQTHGPRLQTRGTAIPVETRAARRRQAQAARLPRLSN